MFRKLQWLLIAGLLAPAGVAQAQAGERGRPRAPMVGQQMQRSFRGVGPFRMERSRGGRAMFRRQATRPFMLRRHFERSQAFRRSGRFMMRPRGQAMLRLRMRGRRSIRI